MLFGERVQSGHHDDDGMGWFQLLLGTSTLSLRVAVVWRRLRAPGLAV